MSCPKWAKSLLLSLLLLLLCTAQASAGGRFFYAITSGDHTLYSVDPVSGATLSTVTMTLTGKTVNGGTALAVNPADGKLYALLSISGSTPRVLCTVDPATGTVTEIGPGDDGSGTLQLAEMTFTGSGILWAASGSTGNNTNSLFTVNTTSGLATLVTALTPSPYGQFLVFNPTDGLLYHGSYNSPITFETIDPANPLNPPVPVTLAGNVPGEPTAGTYWNGYFIWASFQDLYLVRKDGAVRKILTTAMSSAKGLALGGAAPACPQTLYGTAHNGGGKGFDAVDIFFGIDPATGAANAVGPVGFTHIGGMDFDSTGTLYAAGQTMDTNTQVLLKIDPCTGNGTQIGPTGAGNLQDVSVRPTDDVLFGMDGGNGNLVTLNKSTGTSTVVGPTAAGFCSGLGITFNLAGDTLYFQDTCATADLFTVDQTTGATTLIGTAAFPPPGTPSDRFTAMDTSPFSGVIYGSQATGFPATATYLSTLDPTTGNVTIIGQSETGIDALAFGSGLGYTRFNLTVTKSGTGVGTVTGNGINCGATCQVTLNLNTAVTLTATPTAGNVFVGWTGACTGSGACTFNLTQNQTVNAQFSNAPPDFQYGAAPGPQTVNAGQSAHYNISINGGPTFTGVVTFTCTAGLPKGAACSFNPPTVTPGPNGVANTALTITTSSREVFSMDRAPLLPGWGGVYATLLPVAGLVFAGFGAARRKRRGRRTSVWLMFFALLLISGMVLGCGNIPVNPGVANANGTPAGSNSVTVTAASGNISHSLNLTLNVN